MNTILNGRVTVVSGGASGIGKQITYTFAEHGSDIAVLDINKEEGVRITSDIGEKYGVRARFFHCDISD